MDILGKAMYFPLKRFYRFLLKKLIGSFLHQNELDLAQVEVALGQGVIELRDLNLNVAVFNSLVAEAELPLKFVSGTVSRLRAVIPWRNLLSQHCQLELDGLELVLRPSSEEEKTSVESMLRSVIEISPEELQERELQKQIRLHRRLQQRLLQEYEGRGAEPQLAAGNTQAIGADDPADGDNENEESLDQGLRYLRLWTEQLVSQTQIKVQNVSVKIIHRHGLQPARAHAPAHGPELEKETVLAVHLPWLSYASVGEHPDDDGSGPATPAASANLARESPPAPAKPGQPAGKQPSLEPKYEYLKDVRFRGFRVELYEQTRPPGFRRFRRACLAHPEWLGEAGLPGVAAAELRELAEEGDFSLAEDEDGEEEDDDEDDYYYDGDGEAGAEPFDGYVAAASRSAAKQGSRKQPKQRRVRSQRDRQRISQAFREAHSRLLQSLQEANSSVQRRTIIHGDMQQHCHVRLRIRLPNPQFGGAASASQPSQQSSAPVGGSMSGSSILLSYPGSQDTGPGSVRPAAGQTSLETCWFVSSLRALLAPRDLALLGDLLQCLGQESALAAEKVKRRKQRQQKQLLQQQQQQHQKNLRRTQNHPRRPGQGQSRSAFDEGKSDEDDAYDEDDVDWIASSSSSERAASGSAAAGGAGGGPPGAAETSAVLWNVRSHVSLCSITLLQSGDTPWPAGWYLLAEEAGRGQASASAAADWSQPSREEPEPLLLTQAVLPSVVGDHIHMRLENVKMHTTQTSLSLKVSCSGSTGSAYEYLRAYEAGPSEHVGSPGGSAAAQRDHAKLRLQPSVHPNFPFSAHFNSRESPALDAGAAALGSSSAGDLFSLNGGAAVAFNRYSLVSFRPDDTAGPGVTKQSSSASSAASRRHHRRASLGSALGAAGGHDSRLSEDELAASRLAESAEMSAFLEQTSHARNPDFRCDLEIITAVSPDAREAQPGHPRSSMRGGRRQAAAACPGGTFLPEFTHTFSPAIVREALFHSLLGQRRGKGANDGSAGGGRRRCRVRWTDQAGPGHSSSSSSSSEEDEDAEDDGEDGRVPFGRDEDDRPASLDSPREEWERLGVTYSPLGALMLPDHPWTRAPEQFLQALRKCCADCRQRFEELRRGAGPAGGGAVPGSSSAPGVGPLGAGVPKGSSRWSERCERCQRDPYRLLEVFRALQGGTSPGDSPSKSGPPRQQPEGVTARLVVYLQPLLLTMDLGMGQRIQALVDALGLPRQHACFQLRQPLSSAVAAAMGIPAMSRRGSMAESPDSGGAGGDSDDHGVPPPHHRPQLPSTQPATHPTPASPRTQPALPAGPALPDDTPSTEVIVIAPRIKVRLRFPALLEEASLQPRLALLDARGPVRAEWMDLQLALLEVRNGRCRVFDIDSALDTAAAPVAGVPSSVGDHWDIQFFGATALLCSEDPQAQHPPQRRQQRRRIHRELVLSVRSVFRRRELAGVSAISGIAAASSIAIHPMVRLWMNASKPEADTAVAGGVSSSSAPSSTPRFRASDPSGLLDRLWLAATDPKKGWWEPSRRSRTRTGSVAAAEEQSRERSSSMASDSERRGSRRKSSMQSNASRGSRPPAQAQGEPEPPELASGTRFESHSLQLSDAVVWVWLASASAHLSQRTYLRLMRLYEVFADPRAVPGLERLLQQQWEWWSRQIPAHRRLYAQRGARGDVGSAVSPGPAAQQVSRQSSLSDTDADQTDAGSDQEDTGMDSDSQMLMMMSRSVIMPPPRPAGSAAPPQAFVRREIADSSDSELEVDEASRMFHSLVSHSHAAPAPQPQQQQQQVVDRPETLLFQSLVQASDPTAGQAGRVVAADSPGDEDLDLDMSTVFADAGLTSFRHGFLSGATPHQMGDSQLRFDYAGGTFPEGGDASPGDSTGTAAAVDPLAATSSQIMSVLLHVFQADVCLHADPLPPGGVPAGNGGDGNSGGGRPDDDEALGPAEERPGQVRSVWLGAKGLRLFQTNALAGAAMPPGLAAGARGDHARAMAGPQGQSREVPGDPIVYVNVTATDLILREYLHAIAWNEAFPKLWWWKRRSDPLDAAGAADPDEGDDGDEASGNGDNGRRLTASDSDSEDGGGDSASELEFLSNRGGGRPVLFGLFAADSDDDEDEDDDDRDADGGDLGDEAERSRRRGRRSVGAMGSADFSSDSDEEWDRPVRRKPQPDRFVASLDDVLQEAYFPGAAPGSRRRGSMSRNQPPSLHAAGGLQPSFGVPPTLATSSIFQSPRQLRRRRQGKGFWVRHLQLQPHCLRGHFRIQLSRLGGGPGPARVLLARDTQAILFLHALCAQLWSDLGFQQFLTEFFTAVEQPAPEPSLGLGKEHLPRQQAARPVAEPIEVVDVVTLHLNAYDCVVDYNPLDHPARGILATELITLRTVIRPHARDNKLEFEVRDLSLHLLDTSPKPFFDWQFRRQPHPQHQQLLSQAAHGSGLPLPLQPRRMGLRDLLAADQAAGRRIARWYRGEAPPGSSGGRGGHQRRRRARYHHGDGGVLSDDSSVDDQDEAAAWGYPGSLRGGQHSSGTSAASGSLVRFRRPDALRAPQLGDPGRWLWEAGPSYLQHLRQIPAQVGTQRRSWSSVAAHLYRREGWCLARVANMDTLELMLILRTPPEEAIEAAEAPTAGHPPQLPELELEASNGVLHVLTCYDSFVVLTQLLGHFAADLFPEVPPLPSTATYALGSPTASSASPPTAASPTDSAAPASPDSQTSSSRVPAEHHHPQQRSADVLLDEWETAQSRPVEPTGYLEQPPQSPVDEGDDLGEHFMDHMRRVAAQQEQDDDDGEEFKSSWAVADLSQCRSHSVAAAGLPPPVIHIRTGDGLPASAETPSLLYDGEADHSRDSQASLHSRQHPPQPPLAPAAIGGATAQAESDHDEDGDEDLARYVRDFYRSDTPAGNRDDAGVNGGSYSGGSLYMDEDGGAGGLSLQEQMYRREHGSDDELGLFRDDGYFGAAAQGPAAAAVPGHMADDSGYTGHLGSAGLMDALAAGTRFDYFDSQGVNNRQLPEAQGSMRASRDHRGGNSGAEDGPPSPGTGEDAGSWNQRPQLLEDFIPMPDHEQIGLENAREAIAPAEEALRRLPSISRIQLLDVHFVWRLLGGSDWSIGRHPSDGWRPHSHHVVLSYAPISTLSGPRPADADAVPAATPPGSAASETFDQKHSADSSEEPGDSDGIRQQQHQPHQLDRGAPSADRMHLVFPGFPGSAVEGPDFDGTALPPAAHSPGAFELDHDVDASAHSPDEHKHPTAPHMHPFLSGSHAPFAAAADTGPSHAGLQQKLVVREHLLSQRGRRLTETVVELGVSGLHLRSDSYPEGADFASRLSVQCLDFEIRDCLRSSAFEKLLCYYVTDKRGRMLNSYQLSLEILTVRPDVVRSPERLESRIRLGLLPLRLFVDQDTAEFLLAFFAAVGAASAAPLDAAPSVSGALAARSEVATANAPMDDPASMSRRRRSSSSASASGETSSAEPEFRSTLPPVARENPGVDARHLLSVSLDQPVSGAHTASASSPSASASSTTAADTAAPSSAAKPDAPASGGYIQQLVVEPIVLCLDYKPKRVHFERMGGSGSNLQDAVLQMINLFPVENVEVRFPQAEIGGCDGWDAVGAAMLDAWSPSLLAQWQNYLAGIQPIRSVVNIGAGVKDFVVLPVSMYMRSGGAGAARGLRDGTVSLLSAVVLESMNLTTRLAQSAQGLLETVDDAVSSRLAPDRRRAEQQQLAMYPAAPPARLPGESFRHYARRLRQELTALQPAPSQGRGRPHHQQQQQQQPRSAIPFLDGGQDNLSDPERRVRMSKMANQPANFQEGLQQAYACLYQGLLQAAHQVVIVPLEVGMQNGDGGFGLTKNMVMGLPSAILRPLIGATAAVSKTLLGIQNSMDPLKSQKARDKYKNRKPGFRQ